MPEITLAFMQRTAIDVLRKGNQELFHSAMIAWALDPEKTTEHGLGDQVLWAVARTLADRGHPTLVEALQSGHSPKISTELPGKGCRYDIEVRFGDRRIVFENKTKSLEPPGQTDAYQAAGRDVILLGLHELSFTESARNKRPMLTYGDILSCLREASQGGASDGAFSLLLTEYGRYLERELSGFEAIEQEYFGADKFSEHMHHLCHTARYNDNERRYWNLFYLTRLAHELAKDERFAGTKWSFSKDEISGAWLASHSERFDGIPGFAFDETIPLLCPAGGTIWFHIELHAGVFAGRPGDPAGHIQLRARTADANNRELAARFRAKFPLTEAQAHPIVRQNASTFRLAVHPLSRNQLRFREFLPEFEAFATRFGRFL